MFLEHTTKVSAVGNWAGDKAVQALIEHLGAMPEGGWPLPELLEYFVGFDVMIYNPQRENRGKIILWIDGPGKRFHTR